ncbi:Hypothetical protein CAP_2472 [Chondromyces apiculatus DSM 436]|uniref:Uncharacterized protein n=1 Tax=Chondromyces apiculatus DSM 436 TaxID=1192034 RepID=A0A017TAT7_9BACT|nr:Hypothetical protein CAP_2472 [Chondromyces apiculatus DSM 436]
MSRRQRLTLPDDAEEWWSNIPYGSYYLILKWGGGVQLRLGELRTNPPMFRYDPKTDAASEEFKEEDIASGAERYDRLFGKALTRAGWQLPEIDPAAFAVIMRLRCQSDVRLEFIFDTNAMVEGIGHWLAALFAERCDLVVTAVSLRELQDQHGGAKFGLPIRKSVPIEKQKKEVSVFEKDVLGRRQAYLAAMRFREFSGFERIVWRELELEDASLMLSRSGLDKTDKKTSEADTAVLREVRRCIRDRVRGLERFFVTGDVAISRRAATELPDESLIAARVRQLVRKRIYTPSVWWPAGADQGSVLVGHTPMRLIWELLAVGDSIELRSVDNPDHSWTFSAFDAQMWPSDYLSPWMDCIEATTGQPIVEKGDVVFDEDAGASAPRVVPTAVIAGDERIFSRVTIPDIEPIDANFRVGTDTLLNVLASLVQGRTELAVELDELSAEAERHLAQLLEGLKLAKLSERKVEPLARLATMAAAWRSGDRETVSWLITPYLAYAEQIVPANAAHAERPEKTVRLARGLAARLGQGMSLDGAWIPGGANPTHDEVRRTITAQLETQKTVTIYDLFTKVFLRQLAVSPIRAMDSWERIEAAGTFDNIEFRRGGDAPSDERRQRVVKFSADRWTDTNVPLDKFLGYRDLVQVRRSHAG